MCSTMHSLEDLQCLCGESVDNMIDCTDQDMQNLRTFEGESSLGNQAIVKCKSCGEGYTSNQLALNALQKMLHLELGDDQNDNNSDGNHEFDRNELWFYSSVTSRKRVMMELHIMNNFVTQQKDNIIPERTSDRYKKTNAIVTILRNLHNSEHCRSCFKKDYECRMKIPKKKYPANTVTFEDNTTPWYSWKGENSGRKMFVFEEKRTHPDCSVNTHSKVASQFGGCNTNVIGVVDGGSVMYITCYV
jgi:hypothetical protein